MALYLQQNIRVVFVKIPVETLPLPFIYKVNFVKELFSQFGKYGVLQIITLNPYSYKFLCVRPNVGRYNECCSKPCHAMKNFTFIQ